MRYLRRHFPAVKISVEVEKSGRAGLQDLAAEANVVFYSKAWAQVSASKLAIVLIARMNLIWPREMAMRRPRTA